MDKIILKNGKEIETLMMPSISAITVQLPDVQALQELKDALTPEALQEVKTTNAAGITAGVYTELVLQEDWRIAWTGEGIRATFGLRDKTDVERLSDRFDESQAVQDGAINDVAGAVSDIMVTRAGGTK